MKLTALNGSTVYVSASNVATVEPLVKGSRVTSDGGNCIVVTEAVTDIITSIDNERVDNGDLLTALETIASNIAAMKTTATTTTA